MTGLADDELAVRTDELVKQAIQAAQAATYEADELDRTIRALREELWGGNP